MHLVLLKCAQYSYESFFIFIKCVVFNSPERVKDGEEAQLIKNRHIFLHAAEIPRTSIDAMWTSVVVLL